MWLLLLFILVIFGLIGPSIWRMSRRSDAVQKHAKQVMAGRASLTPHQFAEQFFTSDQHATAIFISKQFIDLLIVHAGKVRPDDELIRDLGLGQVDGLDGNFLAVATQQQFDIDVMPIFNKPDLTVRELIEFIAKHQPAR